MIFVKDFVSCCFATPKKSLPKSEELERILVNDYS